MQAIRDMEEKGMQNDSRYPQLVAMARQRAMMQQGYGHMGQDPNLAGPPPYSDASQAQQMNMGQLTLLFDLCRKCTYCRYENLFVRCAIYHDSPLPVVNVMHLD